MLSCHLCKAEVACNLKELYSHFRSRHGISDRYSRYSCCQGQCCRTFTDKYTFGRHIERCHKEDIEYVDKSATSATSRADDPEEVMESSTCDDPCQEQAVQVEFDLRERAAIFISEAKSKLTTLSSVQAMVTACQSLFEAVVDDLIGSLKPISEASGGGNADTWNAIFSKLALYRNPFSGLESEYLQSSYLERRGMLVKSDAYVIGNKPTSVYNRQTSQKNQVNEAVSGEYISIEKTILALDAHSDIIKQALSVTRETNGSSYKNFFDGSHWSQHPLRHESVLAIRLYGDDFEPANPLGSRRSVYKIGCIYYQFENLPSHLLSKTDSMFLALCYHTGDVKEFGWEAVLRPLLMELQVLEQRGIYLDIPDGKRCYKVFVSVITGDNLFLNGILGFVESFTASYPCRHCHIHRNKFQDVKIEEETSLRTSKSYDTALTSQLVQETGIKQRCPLNDLVHFHAAENYVQDIMHDVFEGVCAYDIPLMCSAYVSHGYFDLPALNHRLQTFCYGYSDAANKPPVIQSLNVEMLPFEASQSWCLTRVLSLVVGDLVPESDDTWQLYLLLRNIIDIILAPSVSEDDVSLLSVLVAEYLEMRKNLFPNQSLKNKHHHLIHYPTLIRRVGPLQRYWCMRFESKHQRCKKLLHISGNFKNVLKSCAFRHQLDLSYRLLKNYNSVSCSDDVVVGTGSVITLAEFDNGSEISNCLGGMGTAFELYDANWVTVKGTKYMPGCTVLAKLDDDRKKPVFLHVKHIFVRDQKFVWLFGLVLDTLCFSTHYHGWLVSDHWPEQTMSISPLQLLYFHPVTVHTLAAGSDGRKVVGLRHRV